MSMHSSFLLLCFYKNIFFLNYMRLILRLQFILYEIIIDIYNQTITETNLH